MKRLVIVKPERTDTPDGSSSHYSYPSTGEMQTQVITHNYTLGDFLKEQLWLISGTQEQIDKFVVNPEVMLVATWNEADELTKVWNPNRVVMNDVDAVITEVEALVVILKLEEKDISPVLDSKNTTPGIVIQSFALTDYVTMEELN